MSSSEFALPEAVHTVALGVGDMNGIMRGKRIPATHWDAICAHGCALSISLLAMDMTCDVWDTPYVNFDTGYPDMHVFPNARPVALAFEPGVAICMGRTEGMDHQPVPIDPRNALVRQVARASALGFEVKVGTELEFYLLDPDTGQPVDKGIQVYSLVRAAAFEHVLGPIRQHINDAGIPIEQSNPEYAAGQVEVNIRYDEALVAADRVIMFRTLVKQLAEQHGLLATFMAKPFFERSGSGFHTHYSLWRDKENVFSHEGKLSPLGRHFLAGLQTRMVEMTIAGATTPNAYRRRQPYTFCPINATWGIDNRTVGLRVLEGSPSAVRIEKRDGSADCNPYYLLACEIAAGLDGIEKSMEPPPMTVGNGYEAEAEALPADLRDAIARARGSAFMREVCGNEGLEILLQQAEREQDFIAAQVTPRETERYLRNL